MKQPHFAGILGGTWKLYIVWTNITNVMCVCVCVQVT